MALLGNIIIEKLGSVNIRADEVIGDVIVDGDYFQLRTNAAGDIEREKGSKQNVQFTCEKAIEFRELLDTFINA